MPKFYIKKKNLIFVTSICLFSLFTYGQRGVKQVKKKVFLSKSAIKAIALPPKLRVEEFGGEFAKWVTQMTITSKKVLRFRWSSSQSGVTFATVDVRRGSKYGPRVLKKDLNNIPGPGKVAVFSIDPLANQGGSPIILFASIRLWKAEGQPVGSVSNQVKIIFKNPTLQITQFQLDRLKLLKVTPSPGKHITGPPASNQSLNNGNSVRLTYFYELNTETSAEIRQWPILQNGSIAPNNNWTYETVQKGKGQVTNLANIFCNTPDQAVTRIYGVKYKMMHNGKTLVEKKKMFTRPFFFRCPQSTN
ncbi:MAG: hypothetical protein ABFR75_11190 [Acidobacteriota bacterium]